MTTLLEVFMCTLLCNLFTYLGYMMYRFITNMITEHKKFQYLECINTVINFINLSLNVYEKSQSLHHKKMVELNNLRDEQDYESTLMDDYSSQCVEQMTKLNEGNYKFISDNLINEHKQQENEPLIKLTQTINNLCSNYK
jgi:hypothetical protein